MDFKFLADTVRNIILSTLKEWDAIYARNKPYRLFSRSLFFPLLILASISTFLGSYLFTNTELTNFYSVITGLRYFAVITIVVYGTALGMREMMRSFGYGNDFGIAFKIVCCSVVPLLLCQILSQLIESFIFVNILAFFGFYILYTGIERMLSPSESDRLKLMIGVPLIFFILFILTGRIITQITDKFYFSFFA
ncbi:MAG: hypothetical protein JXR67_00535 [Bacteroidales bacterium]|nr:hypothetical protein [Bacteroidales bacterium]